MTKPRLHFFKVFFADNSTSLLADLLKLNVGTQSPHVPKKVFADRVFKTIKNLGVFIKINRVWKFLHENIQEIVSFNKNATRKQIEEELFRRVSLFSVVTDLKLSTHSKL